MRVDARDQGQLAGRVAVVTGGGTGIGRASALLLAAEGARVAVAGRRREPLGEVVAAMPPGSGLAVPTDVSDSAAVERLFATVDDWAGPLDILVNSAGIGTTPQHGERVRAQLRQRLRESKEGAEPSTPWDVTSTLPDEEWQQMIAINLTGPFYTTRAALRRMLPRGSGSIIQISSDSAMLGEVFAPHYTAAKAGLIGFAKAVAQEAAPRGVRVNTVAPGWVETPMTEGLNPEIIRRTTGEYVRMGRFGRPEEIATAVLFLASDASSFVTGQVIVPNGGAWMP